MQPTSDEVQIYLNKAVQTIISISKNISQWNKDRPRVSEIIGNLNKENDV